MANVVLDIEVCDELGCAEVSNVKTEGNENSWVLMGSVLNPPQVESLSPAQVIKQSFLSVSPCLPYEFPQKHSCLKKIPNN
ncbi:hypothetical protein BpHYR1_051285 [Brachionus plicatilis]|uniref:Uncharacterized protein n=1 Tax=Brachionus plicatilis TaxID=10195 RepID=A0A3M7S7Y8_BRAPC|nr:hypothetical protein BpHYR1_051285 [Brachionus plicatilis]